MAAGKSESQTFISCRHKMSGDSSVRNFSTISMRARTELMFQEAILRVEDMASALTGSAYAVDDGSAPDS